MRFVLMCFKGIPTLTNLYSTNVFVKSRSSKDDPKRDWYIWRPPKYDSEGNRHPPNNWRSVFEGNGNMYIPLFFVERLRFRMGL